jgi:hypothetical protein
MCTVRSVDTDILRSSISDCDSAIAEGRNVLDIVQKVSFITVRHTNLYERFSAKSPHLKIVTQFRRLVTR